MPDPDPDSQYTETDTTQGGGQEGSYNFAPDHDSNAQEPRPEPDGGHVVSKEEIQGQREAFGAALQRVLDQGRANQGYETQMMGELKKLQEEAAQPPPQEAAPQQLPPPPDQNQKHTIAELATKLLTGFGVLALAYGTSRRSPLRGASFKNAIGSALNGYYEGQQQLQHQTLARWEKDRQFIQDQNRLQHQQYQEAFNNRKFTLQQRIDVMRELASMWGNKRMQDAALRQDVMAMQKTMDDEIKLQQHWEKQTRDQRKEWYKLMGMDAREGREYRDWVRSKGGPDLDTLGDDADKWHAVESKFPRHQFLEDKYQEDKRRKVETAGAEERERLKVKKEFKDTESGTATDPNNPLDLNLGGQ